MGLSQVFEIQLFGELHDARGWANVEGARTLALRLERVADLPVGERLGLDADDVRILLLALGYLGLVAGHVELRRTLAAHNGQPLFRGGLESSSLSPILILCLDVENVLHVELEGLGAASADDARSLVHLEAATSSVANEEVVDVVVSVGILGLEREHPCIWGSVELDHSLHRQRPVDEVGRLIVDVFDADDHSLVVRICEDSIQRLHYLGT